MTEKKQTDGIGFALRKISLDQFAVLKEAYQEGEKVGFDVSLGFWARYWAKDVQGFVPYSFFPTENTTFSCD